MQTRILELTKLGQVTQHQKFIVMFGISESKLEQIRHDNYFGQNPE